MRTDQSERIDELRFQLENGQISIESFQQQSTAILLDDSPASESYVATDDNPPPSPIHVWNGTSWTLPAQHELDMLADMDNATEEDTAAAEDRLADQTAAAEESK